VKFLHTADWHIGRTVRGRSRDDEHRAALEQVLSHVREQHVDCVLIAGDVFDTSAPSAESERLAFDFLTELTGLRVPAVVIAGNHDHPRRVQALAPILKPLGLHLLGEPAAAADGGVATITSAAGERAVIASLPWVHERQAIEFVQLNQEVGAAYRQYAEQLGLALGSLARSFEPGAVNILLAHLLVDGATVGPGGGERELHMAMGIYGLPVQMLPPEAQYTALGHVHRPQTVRSSPAACYPGSLLQLDFGEQRQDKGVNLVEAHPGRPAEVATLPITAGRPLLDIGTPAHGINLADLAQHAEQAANAWVRVFVEVDTPIANLSELVREALPTAVHVERLKHGATEQPGSTLSGLGPSDLFATFYRSSLGRGQEPSTETLELFRQLVEEESRATADA